MTSWTKGCLIGTVLLLQIASPARAQSEYQLEIRTGQLLRIPIHVEDFAYEGSAPFRFPTGEAPEQVLVRDLEFADFFTVSRGAASSGDSASIASRAPLGTRAIASARVRELWGRAVVTGALRDAQTGQRIFQTDYPLGDPPDRWAVHGFSDEIVLYLTGERGVAQTRIAFVRDHGSTREIHLIDYDGQNEKQLTRLGTIVLSPAWAPAGDRIAFTSFASDRRTVVGLGLTDGRYWTISPLDGMNASPAWTPDGRWVAFTRSVEGNAEIYVVDAGGGRPERLTIHPAIDTSPTISPDGHMIAFTSDRSGRPEIYVIDREGSNVRRLTYAGSQSDSPDWSPKGDRIAYVCLLDNVLDLFTMRPDGSDIQRLTAGEGMHENPKWAPDGRHIVYSKLQGGQRRLYIMASNGSGKRALTGGTGAQYNPDWSPAMSQQTARY